MEYARLDAVKFGLAAGITVFLLGLVFFLLSLLTGGMMMMRMGMGMGAEFEGMAGSTGMMFAGFLMSGLFSGIVTGIFAGVMAAIYNRLL